MLNLNNKLRLFMRLQKLLPGRIAVARVIAPGGLRIFRSQRTQALGASANRSVDRTLMERRIDEENLQFLH
ncbi:MAG: hypothetical protein ACU84H_04065 [Gammaproteobacteria bacterium]